MAKTKSSKGKKRATKVPRRERGELTAKDADKVAGGVGELGVRAVTYAAGNFGALGVRGITYQ